MEQNLSVCVAKYPFVESILDRSIQLSDGATLNVAERPFGLSFEEIIRYDVFEFPIIRYMAGRELGYEWTAIPIFTTRRFLQWMIEVPENSDIHNVKDLEGKRIGHRNYGMTDAVVAKGHLEQDYDVDLSGVSWFTYTQEILAAAGARAPEGVVLLEGANPNELMLSGTVDAVIIDGWGTPTAPGIRRLWADPDGEAAKWYRSAKVFPILHVMVAKDVVLAQHPSLANELYGIFETAKDESLKKWDYGASLPDDRRAIAVRSGFPFRPQGTSDRTFLPKDPMPYGLNLESNRDSLQRAVRYSLEQGVLQQSYSLEDLYSAVEI